MPPNAAATESWKNRSGSASDATRVWVWTSTTPGSTSSPVASITSSAPAARPLRSGSMAVIRPPSTAISATREPPAVTTVPAADEQIGHPCVMPSMGIKSRPVSAGARNQASSAARGRPRHRTPPAADRRRSRPITRPRGSRSPGRPPTGSAGPSRAVGRPSPRRPRRVAKWLAASWPTFDAVVQPPYGKKISHSLMPPG